MIDDIIQLKVDKILLGINAHNIIKKIKRTLGTMTIILLERRMFCYA